MYIHRLCCIAKKSMCLATFMVAVWGEHASMKLGRPARERRKACLTSLATNVAIIYEGSCEMEEVWGEKGHIYLGCRRGPAGQKRAIPAMYKRSLQVEVRNARGRGMSKASQLLLGMQAASSKTPRKRKRLAGVPSDRPTPPKVGKHDVGKAVGRDSVPFDMFLSSS